MMKDEIKEVLEQHKHWLNEDCDGWEDMRAYLSGADLSGADLSRANLSGADLYDIKANYMTVGIELACPEEGSFIGYKKAHGCLVKLLIPEDAKRSSGTTRKCRCDKAKVLAITEIETGKPVDKVSSDRDKDFIYQVGHEVNIINFCENRWIECSEGIHFFMAKNDALSYQ